MLRITTQKILFNKMIKNNVKRYSTKMTYQVGQLTQLNDHKSEYAKLFSMAFMNRIHQHPCPSVINHLPDANKTLSEYVNLHTIFWNLPKTFTSQNLCIDNELNIIIKRLQSQIDEFKKIIEKNNLQKQVKDDLDYLLNE
jgi:DNA repair exonuclease SbcCD ATPase subunit